MEILKDYINSTTSHSEAMEHARQSADELALETPDEMTTAFLTALAASCSEPKSAIVISPAACVTGLAIIGGLGSDGHVTCIDTEIEHQQLTKEAFRDAGLAPSQLRFLPSRPLEVMTRLATEAYSFIYAEIAPADAETLVDEALPLLTSGGMLILADILLDGTIADESRTDRDTAAARTLDEQLRSREDIHLARLPLGAGLVVITKK